MPELLYSNTLLRYSLQSTLRNRSSSQTAAHRAGGVMCVSLQFDSTSRFLQMMQSEWNWAKRRKVQRLFKNKTTYRSHITGVLGKGAYIFTGTWSPSLPPQYPNYKTPVLYLRKWLRERRQPKCLILTASKERRGCGRFRDSTVKHFICRTASVCQRNLWVTKELYFK